MSTVMTWHACPTRVETETRAPSAFTSRDAGFLMGRLYTSRSPRRFTLFYERATPGMWQEARAAYRSTYGGALRVAWTPPSDPSEIEVRFASQPLAATIRGAVSVDFQVVFDEVDV